MIETDHSRCTDHQQGHRERRIGFLSPGLATVCDELDEVQRFG